MATKEKRKQTNNSTQHNIENPRLNNTNPIKPEGDLMYFGRVTRC